MSCPQGYDKATIFIKPIAHDATVEELQLYYEQFGDILSVNIPADRLTQQFKGYAFIEFLHPDDAATARDHTNGSILLGHNVTVEIAEGPRKSDSVSLFKANRLRSGELEALHRPWLLAWLGEAAGKLLLPTCTASIRDLISTKVCAAGCKLL
ncbi:hypothetical protein BOX15_Mlig015740g2 [Macrostomum lignano]|uniref:RRM domain-containing protein n=1 Tax=Macrostomum lignano TaxID=282301 RepID=A0A267FL71_9PLAT|nr:hypothetical protein BOX15_Mlig015740g2 [Macrostomum lignano]